MKMLYQLNIVNNGLIYKHTTKQGLVLNSLKTYERDHEVINFSNDDSFDLRSSDKLSRAFLPSIKPCVDQYLRDYSVLGDGKFLCMM